jgi:hypothetical protein
LPRNPFVQPKQSGVALADLVCHQNGPISYQSKNHSGGATKLACIFHFYQSEMDAYALSIFLASL